MRLPQHLIAREGYHGTRSKAIEEVERNETQCQLYKRLAGQFIPPSWSCLVWKRHSLWM